MTGDIVSVYKNCLKRHNQTEFALIIEEISCIPDETIENFIENKEKEIRKEIMGLIRLKEYIKIKKMQLATVESTSCTTESLYEPSNRYIPQ